MPARIPKWEEELESEPVKAEPTIKTESPDGNLASLSEVESKPDPDAQDEPLGPKKRQ
jgi:hypothetical protein